MEAIDDKVGFYEHGSELPHEHNSQLEREEEPGGSAQQYTLTSSVYTTMPEKVKAMEFLQDLSSSMIRLLPQGIIQLLPVNAVSR